MDLSSHGREIPNPIPINSKYVGDHSGHVHNIVHDPSHPHRPSTNGPPPPPPPPLTTINATSPDDDNNNSNIISYNHESNINKKGVVVKYRECLKNHAASIGGNATDGCGEFMPSGEEGTMEALKCSACNCHRNFHRKEVEGESSSFEFYHHNHLHLKGRKLVGQKGVLISGSDPFGYNPSHNSLIPMPSPHHMIMPLGAIQSSESDEMEGGARGVMSRGPVMKKRFRTKFTPEQKEKMMSFAEKIGWRLQKQEESVVQQFCQEIGVKRRVLRVWMHNNKHQSSKKGCIQLEHF